MSKNTNPIFSGGADAQWAAAALTTANTTKTGVGATPIFTANAVNGGFVSYIRLIPLGTNVASVVRIFMNNGLTDTTPANNVMIANAVLPASTLSEVAAVNTIDIPINLPIKQGYRLMATLGTAVAAGYSIVVFGNDYTPS